MMAPPDEVYLVIEWLGGHDESRVVAVCATEDCAYDLARLRGEDDCWVEAWEVLK